MSVDKLKGWNLLIYQLIKNKFSYKEFVLKDIYEYESEFKKVYPENLHIQDKIRQILQNLVRLSLIEYVVKGSGRYKFINNTYNINNDALTLNDNNDIGVVYLLSNEAMPEWVKIGRSMRLDERINELYNTSVPLPFRLEDHVEVTSFNDSKILERCIHSVIDTINPNLRKNTEASKREFFKMSVEQARTVFQLVRLINTVDVSKNNINVLNTQI